MKRKLKALPKLIVYAAMRWIENLNNMEMIGLHAIFGSWCTKSVTDWVAVPQV
jgi:hypothetical protein